MQARFASFTTVGSVIVCVGQLCIRGPHFTHLLDPSFTPSDSDGLRRSEVLTGCTFPKYRAYQIGSCEEMDVQMTVATRR